MVVASYGAAVKSAGGSWSPLQRSRWGGASPPLLEEAHALAAAVGAPEVAAAGRGVAAVAGTVVTVAAPPDTGTPENVDQRRTSETISSNTNLSLCSTCLDCADMHGEGFNSFNYFCPTLKY